MLGCDSRRANTLPGNLLLPPQLDSECRGCSAPGLPALLPRTCSKLPCCSCSCSRSVTPSDAAFPSAWCTTSTSALWLASASSSSSAVPQGGGALGLLLPRPAGNVLLRAPAPAFRGFAEALAADMGRCPAASAGATYLARCDCAAGPWLAARPRAGGVLGPTPLRPAGPSRPSGQAWVRARMPPPLLPQPQAALLLTLLATGLSQPSVPSKFFHDSRLMPRRGRRGAACAAEVGGTGCIARRPVLGLRAIAPVAVAAGDRGVLCMVRGVAGGTGAEPAEASASCWLGDLVSSERAPELEGGLCLLADVPLLRLLATWAPRPLGLDGTSGPLACCWRCWCRRGDVGTCCCCCCCCCCSRQRSASCEELACGFVGLLLLLLALPARMLLLLLGPSAAEGLGAATLSSCRRRVLLGLRVLELCCSCCCSRCAKGECSGGGRGERRPEAGSGSLDSTPVGGVMKRSCCASCCCCCCCCSCWCRC